MQKIKSLVVEILNQATMRYLRRSNVKIIAVAGSIGKTSTVNAIRTVLALKYRVHVPSTAYNTNKSVHLEIFNQKFATTTAGWLLVTGKMLLKSLGRADFDVVVVEIGTDHPGEMRSFAFLKPHIGVLTAIAPEHMENFKDIDAVATEELVIVDYCERLVFNADTVSDGLVSDELKSRIVWYGTGSENAASQYAFAGGDVTGVTAEFTIGQHRLGTVPLKVIGEHSLQALLAAATVGTLCGLSREQTIEGIASVRPVKGRMQLLKGINDTNIIDDSYNSSPDATKAALDMIYRLDAPRRIAILGTMNEMGDYSEQAHREVGTYCDPAKLDLVVTIGKDAERYLAPAARQRGCKVRSFISPYDAGEFVRQQLDESHDPNLGKPMAVLVKGSQNQVFTEESIKSFLADPADVSELVRQSDFWMQRKREQFGAH